MQNSAFLRLVVFPVPVGAIPSSLLDIEKGPPSWHLRLETGLPRAPHDSSRSRVHANTTLGARFSGCWFASRAGHSIREIGDRAEPRKSDLYSISSMRSTTKADVSLAKMVAKPDVEMPKVIRNDCHPHIRSWKRAVTSRLLAPALGEGAPRRTLAHGCFCWTLECAR